MKLHNKTKGCHYAHPLGDEAAPATQIPTRQIERTRDAVHAAWERTGENLLYQRKENTTRDARIAHLRALAIGRGEYKVVHTPTPGLQS